VPDIGIINKDLILDRKSEEIPATPKNEEFEYFVYVEKDHFCNIWLREGLKEEKDYIIADRGIWEFFIDQGFESICVPRMAYFDANKEKHIEITLQQVKHHYFPS